MIWLLNEKEIWKIELYNINSLTIKMFNENIIIRDYKKQCNWVDIILLSWKKESFINYINIIKKKTWFIKNTKSYFDTFPEVVKEYSIEYNQMLKENNL